MFRSQRSSLFGFMGSWVGTLTIYNYKEGHIDVKSNKTNAKEDAWGLHPGYSVYLDGKWIGEQKDIDKDKVIYL